MIIAVDGQPLAASSADAASEGYAENVENVAPSIGLTGPGCQISGHFQPCG